MSSDSTQNQTWIFDRIYTHYPGTTRSHISMMTGGKTPTKSSLFALSSHHYHGQSLPQILKKRGYSTWLVSAMGLKFEELDHYYSEFKFDETFDPDQEKKYIKDRVNPWGVDEDSVVKFIRRKLKDHTPPKKFYLQILTNSTHYPYLFKGIEKEKDLKRRYALARFKTDQMIKTVVEEIKKKNLLEQTTIFITGDHGESFGEWHKDNLTHRNYLFEENIRSFFLVYDSAIQKSILSSRVGGLADTMPSILQQDTGLFSKNYKEKMQFFHKNTTPLEWGVVDGDWKFIGSQDGKISFLYNLKQDPHEQNNLSEKYPGKVKFYKGITGQWFTAKDRQFLETLD